MSQKHENNEVLEEALKLLPWYTTGRLTPEEKSYVDDALVQYPELQEQLKLEYRIQQFVTEEETLFHLSDIAPSEERLKAVFNDKVFNTTDTDTTVHHSLHKQSGIIDFFQSLVSGNMTKAQYAGIISVITLSFGLLLAFVGPLVNPPNTFHPAYMGIKQSNETSILVGLSIAPDDNRITTLLDKFKTETTAISGKKGMYRISFTEKPDPQDLRILLRKLSENEELVWFVGESY